MNASKEEAAKAGIAILEAADLLDVAVTDKPQRDEIKKRLIRIEAFVDAAKSKLPTEAAFARDKDRRKTAAK